MMANRGGPARRTPEEERSLCVIDVCARNRHQHDRRHCQVLVASDARFGLWLAAARWDYPFLDALPLPLYLYVTILIL
jgi:hypothetical protein